MKRICSIIFFLLTISFVKAQSKLTLRQAIEMGIANNIDVNKADLSSQQAHITMQQSKLSMLPNVNASANYGINSGRTNDPITNAFINQNINSSNYGITANVTLFNGLALQNDIKSNALAYEASKMELQQSKDNLTINIILAYLNVLSAEDLLQNARLQEEATRRQVDIDSLKNAAGSISPSDYYTLKGQLGTDQLNIADNVASIAVAKLSLAQLLNIPYSDSLEVERLSEDVFNLYYEADPSKIYDTALQQFAQIKAVHFRTESAEKYVRALQGQLYPTLSLNGSIGSNYSSAITNSILLNSQDVASNDYVIVNGSQIPVMTKQNTYNTEKVSFGTQFNNNLSKYVGLGLSIPIFNGARARSRVRTAKIQFKVTQLVEQNTKTLLQQSIEQAYVNFKNTSNKYSILLDQVQSFTESFKAAQAKFDAGAITSDIYLIAKNNLNATNINLIVSKYNFVLRAKILDYYKGKSLW
ncbi:TolC family protein [Ginsengibacter hankyongi]|uniref:TolC family protein n=1 Tax=Ginsengibacter hankyongi TaxID=2607284 RepID=A0A5J5IIX5_9BACT|nr:TolC family protein [Ginsengibacter hankyongi]KAA9040896.1 TolC family protein [Ginsengibacter hankyongi]